MASVVYSRHYNIRFYGFERLHPFDSCKYGRAWKLLKEHFGSSLDSMWVRPKQPANQEELKLVHTDGYLEQLQSSEYLADALELPQLRRIPRWLVDWHVLRPMRWATRGTILAAMECLNHGLSINLSGGYHHASPTCGEGFCIYADAGLAVASLRSDGLIEQESRIIYIDTDAHQGNGVCHTFAKDDRVFIFDIYNSHIYPLSDVEAADRIDCNVRITSACTTSEYLRELQGRLPGFLDSVGNSPIALAIYNAGTDVFRGDALGQLDISAEGILKRDLFVVEELRKRGIPTVMLLSGGYTGESYRLIADSVIRLLELHT